MISKLGELPNALEMNHRTSVEVGMDERVYAWMDEEERTVVGWAWLWSADKKLTKDFGSANEFGILLGRLEKAGLANFRVEEEGNNLVGYYKKVNGK